MTETTAPAHPGKRPGRNAFFFVLVTVFIDHLAFGLIIPVLPQLIQELAHVPPEGAPLWIGGLAATYAVMTFFFGPLIGALSDRFGRRPVLLVSMATLGIDFLIMGLAPNIWLLFLGRALAGISGATFSTANAYIADTTSPEERGRAFGFIGAAFGLGFIFGPVAGGLLGEISIHAPFFVAAGLACLNFLYGVFVLPESLPQDRRRALNLTRANPLGAARHFAKLPHIAWFLVTSVFIFLAAMVYPATWSVYGEIRYGWSPLQIGLSLGLVGIGAAAVQAGLMGLILKRLGLIRTVLLGITVSMLTAFGFAFAGRPEIAYAIIVVNALGGVTMPALNAVMSRLTPADAQGELQGAASSLNAIGMIIGPLIMTGALYAFTQPGAPIYLPGAAFLLSAALLVLALLPFRAGVNLNRDALPKSGG
ncbi:TCR/Tet family MFS transporter [Hyphomonas sp. WL0036]|uniref:TCR/Tet family MFS transporter n=1 Tax=Hyphomonas sediminis TaxID=2866160 RepID=UPI001C7FC332|nr:TCR/Tet family MFS transporter [Hyphomonas sediminis]MBY9065534.1 TCR/Tet family MFS transporter [Hyphomonas sediminis]